MAIEIDPFLAEKIHRLIKSQQLPQSVSLTIDLVESSEIELFFQSADPRWVRLQDLQGPRPNQLVAQLTNEAFYYLALGYLRLINEGNSEAIELLLEQINLGSRMKYLPKYFKDVISMLADVVIWDLTPDAEKALKQLLERVSNGETESGDMKAL